MERKVRELQHRLDEEKLASRREKLSLARLQREMARQKSELPLVSTNFFLTFWALGQCFFPGDCPCLGHLVSNPDKIFQFHGMFVHGDGKLHLVEELMVWSVR